MTDDSTAEKAWEEYAIPEGLVYNMPNSSERRAFMAGRASVPDVTALLRERAELREQLAALKRAKAENDDRYMVERDEAREQLAEAQATIERIRMARSDHPACDVHDDGDVVSCGWKRAVVDIDAILSAPSSTGGAVSK